MLERKAKRREYDQKRRSKKIVKIDPIVQEIKLLESEAEKIEKQVKELKDKAKELREKANSLKGEKKVEEPHLIQCAWKNCNNMFEIDAAKKKRFCCSRCRMNENSVLYKKRKAQSN
jgi:predicted nuclease with TOPRIM domain